MYDDQMFMVWPFPYSMHSAEESVASYLVSESDMKHSHPLVCAPSLCDQVH